MTSFTIHDAASAPEASRSVLTGAQQSMGMVPNLYGVLAASPAALKAYADLNDLLSKESAFSATELQTVFLAISFENNCEYCIGAHTVVAGMQKVDDDVVRALRDGEPLADAKLEALRTFATKVVTERGFVGEQALEAFLAAGYTQRHVLEVITAVSMKVISNYTNHIAATPLDEAFQPAAWKKPASVA